MASAAAAAAMGTSALNSIDVDVDLDSPAAPLLPAAAAAQDASTGPDRIAAYELPRSKGAHLCTLRLHCVADGP